MSETLSLITPPDIEPISVEEFKAFVRFDPPEEDGLIAELITAAREASEKYTRRSFISTGWRLYLSSFGLASDIRLRRATVKSIESVKYIDAAGDEQTIAPIRYAVRNENRLFLDPSWAWPQVNREVPVGVTIDFTVGYGDDPTEVPAGIKTALKFYVAHLWENRKPDEREDMPKHVETMLSRFRVL